MCWQLIFVLPNEITKLTVKWWPPATTSFTHRIITLFFLAAPLSVALCNFKMISMTRHCKRVKNVIVIISHIITSFSVFLFRLASIVVITDSNDLLKCHYVHAICMSVSTLNMYLKLLRTNKKNADKTAHFPTETTTTTSLKHEGLRRAYSTFDRMASDRRMLFLILFILSTLMILMRNKGCLLGDASSFKARFRYLVFCLWTKSNFRCTAVFFKLFFPFQHIRIKNIRV